MVASKHTLLSYLSLGVPDHIDVLGPRFAPVMLEDVQTDFGSKVHPETSFRGYEPGDIPECARMAEDAWPAGSALGSKEQELSDMEGYMEYSLSVSNWTEIACTSDGIVGFLFGRIDNYLGKEKPKKSLLGEIPSITKSFFEYGRMTPSLLRFLWNLALTEMKVKLRTPKSDASIEMFIVDSKHRGKGVGSELVNRFLSAAKEAGSSLVTVYTDDRMSNWQFYEKRGFRRVGTFYDNVTSHYSGLDSRGIIFTLDLKEGRWHPGLAQKPSD
jgi:ribosomal protein S18 acetylase RimI-like enzyme